MSYIDGYVLTVKRERMETYRKQAEKAGAVWMKHGALSYKEAIGEDMTPPSEAMGSYLKTLDVKADEVVVFAYVLFTSRAHRDEVNQKVMVELGDVCKEDEMPFEMHRMHYAGFETIVDL